MNDYEFEGLLTGEQAEKYRAGTAEIKAGAALERRAVLKTDKIKKPVRTRGFKIKLALTASAAFFSIALLLLSIPVMEAYSQYNKGYDFRSATQIADTKQLKSMLGMEWAPRIALGCSNTPDISEMTMRVYTSGDNIADTIPSVSPAEDSARETVSGNNIKADGRGNYYFLQGGGFTVLAEREGEFLRIYSQTFEDFEGGDLFLTPDYKAVLVGKKSNDVTGIIVIDVSDTQNISIVYRAALDGYYNMSEYIIADGSLFVNTHFSPDKKNLLPKISENGGAGYAFPLSSVYYFNRQFAGIINVFAKIDLDSFGISVKAYVMPGMRLAVTADSVFALTQDYAEDNCTEHKGLSYSMGGAWFNGDLTKPAKYQTYVTHALRFRLSDLTFEKSALMAGSLSSNNMSVYTAESGRSGLRAVVTHNCRYSGLHSLAYIFDGGFNPVIPADGASPIDKNAFALGGGQIHSVFFYGDTAFASAIGDNKSVRILDFSEKGVAEYTKDFGEEGYYRHFYLSKDGKYLAAMGGVADGMETRLSFDVLDISDRQNIVKHSGEVFPEGVYSHDSVDSGAPGLIFSNGVFAFGTRRSAVTQETLNCYAFGEGGVLLAGRLTNSFLGMRRAALTDGHYFVLCKGQIAIFDATQVTGGASPAAFQWFGI